MSTADVPCPTCGTPASGKCVHWVGTADLIAELRRAAHKKRADLALQSAALFTRAADALEAATKDAETMHQRWLNVADWNLKHIDCGRVVSSVAELDALPAGSIVRAEYDGWVTAERAHGLWYVTTWGDDNGLTSQLLHDWVEAVAFTVLWVGGTEQNDAEPPRVTDHAPTDSQGTMYFSAPLPDLWGL